MEKQYYSIKSLDEFEFSEIDMDLLNTLFGKDWYNDEEKEYPNSVGSYYKDGYPILIDRLIDKLNEFKQKGANYVSLEYHCDHIGYPIEALLIERMSDSDIEDHEQKILKKKEEEKQKKIEELQKQIKQIENN